jgi:hypothetical protein
MYPSSALGFTFIGRDDSCQPLVLVKASCLAPNTYIDIAHASSEADNGIFGHSCGKAAVFGTGDDAKMRMETQNVFRRQM